MMNKKTVYINGRFLTQPKTGVQRFATELITAFDQVVGGDPSVVKNFNFVCLVPKDTDDVELPEWKNILIQKSGKFTQNIWEQIELPFFARKGLLIDLCNIGPLFHFNQVVILHDASVFAVPEAYSLTFRAKYQLIMWVLSRTAKQIITISKFSKKELSHYLRIKEERINVIPEGCEHILRFEPDTQILSENGLLEKPFILAVGSSSAHKNLMRVVEAVETLDTTLFSLVVAGGNFSRVFSGIRTFSSPNIKQLGFVTDGQLRSLYSKAVCFIFPSIYEGFGLPPLEAMSCGCPVLCSNNASMPEVCGDAASYFDPFNQQEIAACIAELAGSPLLQETLRQKGLERANQFTWRETAKQLWKVICKIVY